MPDGNSHFLAALGNHDGGHVVETMDEQLRQVISAVRRTGKTGKLKLELSVSPNGNGLKINFKHSTSLPSLASGDSFYFADQHNDLSREAPRDELPALFEGRTLSTIPR